MKVILLMGFALCFGMSGFGMEETVTGADGLGSGSERPTKRVGESDDIGGGKATKEFKGDSPSSVIEVPAKKLQVVGIDVEENEITEDASLDRTNPSDTKETTLSDKEFFEKRECFDSYSTNEQWKWRDDKSLALLNWLSSEEPIEKKATLDMINKWIKEYQEQIFGEQPLTEGQRWVLAYDIVTDVEFMLGDKDDYRLQITQDREDEILNLIWLALPLLQTSPGEE